MTEQNFTDEDVVYALEACIKDQHEGCCELGNWHEQWNCMAALMEKSLTVIKRQEAEIKRLKADVIVAEQNEKTTKALLVEAVKRSHAAKAEAVREFAERAQTFYEKLPGNTVGGSVAYYLGQIAKEIINGNAKDGG